MARHAEGRARGLPVEGRAEPQQTPAGGVGRALRIRVDEFRIGRCVSVDATPEKPHQVGSESEVWRDPAFDAHAQLRTQIRVALIWQQSLAAGRALAVDERLARAETREAIELDGMSWIDEEQAVHEQRFFEAWKAVVVGTPEHLQRTFYGDVWDGTKAKSGAEAVHTSVRRHGSIAPQQTNAGMKAQTPLAKAETMTRLSRAHARDVDADPPIVARSAGLVQRRSRNGSGRGGGSRRLPRCRLGRARRRVRSGRRRSWGRLFAEPVTVGALARGPGSGALADPKRGDDDGEGEAAHGSFGSLAVPEHRGIRDQTLRVRSARTAPVASVVIKPGHVQPIWAGHPWVFAQAVERIEGGAQGGDEVEVKDARGNFLGRGLYSPGSAIPVRILTRSRDQRVDAKLLASRLSAAIERRRRLGLPSADTNAVRLVHAEGDELPGLVIDQLGDVLSVQFGTLGMKRRETALLDALEEQLEPRAIVDRTSERAAKSEGFAAGRGVVRGDTALTHFELQERGLRFSIPLELGQKTGFYVDQRDLRARVEQLAGGRRVLDTYAFVGTFALGAARGGAVEVAAVDQSSLALTVAADAARLNGLEGKVRFECEDSALALDRAGKHGGFDLVVCDPPKLAPTRAARARALSMMRKLAGQAARATTPGGLLVLCSCSAAIGMAELTRALSLGATDVGVRAIVLERFFQGADHPVPAAFPEGLYLSSLIAEIGKG